VHARPAWPQGLDALVLDTGRPASSPHLVGQVKAYRERAPKRYAAAIEPLVTAAEAGADAFAQGDVGTFVDTVDAYAEAMAALGSSAGADIVSDAHRRLQALARDHDAHYKPSGAGGGDLGLAFGDDPDGLQQLTTAAARAGFATLPIALAAAGSGAQANRGHAGHSQQG